jgi:DNA-binding transcriptional regulator YiaG
MNTICNCGGTLRPARLRDVDLRPYFGVDAVAKEAEGRRCDKCGGEVLTAPAITKLRNQLAAVILGSPERLPAKQLSFLRRYLDLTQQELAKKMGITRKTVSQWESKGGISPQHDLILRLLVYTRLDAAYRPELAVLDHVRTGAAKKAKGALIVRAA